MPYADLATWTRISRGSANFWPKLEIRTWSYQSRRVTPCTWQTSFGKFNQFFASWLDLDQIFSLQNKHGSGEERRIVKIALSCVKFMLCTCRLIYQVTIFFGPRKFSLSFAMFIWQIQWKQKLFAIYLRNSSSSKISKNLAQVWAASKVKGCLCIIGSTQ